MNNFSANSPTKEIMTFLEELITNARELQIDVTTRHQSLFNDAKKHVNDVIRDQENLLTMLGAFGEIPNGMSNYEWWEYESNWFQKHFMQPPPDDRQTHTKNIEREAVKRAKENIEYVLGDMKTMEDFYQTLEQDARDAAELTQWQAINYATGYKIMIKLLNDELPPDMLAMYVKLQNFERNLTAIEDMYKSLTVYEFETVTIEEDMLTKIDSVHKITTTESLK